MTPEDRAREFLSLGIPVSRCLFAEFKDRLVAAFSAAESDARRGALEGLEALAERWMCCNEGRLPTETENERRKCALELVRVIRGSRSLSETGGRR